MKITNFARSTAFAVCALSASFAYAADISGAGATFPYPIYAKWADTYKKETGNGLNYQSIGSGGGIKQIKAKTVTFGASDMPLEPKDVTAAGLVQFPTVVGGDVPVVNLDGIGADELVLDGPTLADIFLGKITKWDDPAIAKLNPNVKLPSQAIVVVHRSDGSGTTFIFTNYLSKVSAAMEIRRRRQHRRRMAGRHRRQGQRRRREQRDPDQGRDRLRRIRLRLAEQDGVGRHDQRSTASGSSRTPRRSRRPRPTPTGRSPTTITSF